MLGNDLIGIVKLVDRRVVCKNQAMDRNFGYTGAEWQDMSARKLYTDEEAYLAIGADSQAAMRKGQTTVAGAGGPSGQAARPPGLQARPPRTLHCADGPSSERRGRVPDRRTRCGLRHHATAATAISTIRTGACRYV